MARLSRKQRKITRRQERKTQPSPEVRERPVLKERGLLEFYRTKYKILLLIPFIILALAIGQIAFQTVTTGDFINKGVSLRGGVTLTVFGSYGLEALELEEFLAAGVNDDISVRLLRNTGVNSGYIIDAPVGSETEILDLTRQKLGDFTKDDYTIEQTGSSLGESFFRETAIALVIAFIMMGLVVFLYFRLLVPSAAVILAAFSDIVVTIAIVNLLGVKLSTGGIAAFLMLIGYSVDTDILLSTRVLKNKAGTVFSRVIDAMKTGMTMNLTTLGAVIVGFLLSQSATLQQVFLILIIGLLVDIINTWLQNAGLLRYYLENGKN